MKNLHFLDKVIYFLNGVAAALLLLSYVLPYIPPKSFSFLSVLSLSVPVLLVVNALFLTYWLVKWKKQLLLSLLVLVLGYNYVSTLYKFSSAKNVKGVTNDLSVMSYNVRLFNVYEWIDNPKVPEDISALVSKESPDIVAFQEFHPHKEVDLNQYPYKFESLSGKRMRYGQAIYSKYPIVNKGLIKFRGSANKAIFVDILKKRDTVRVYNVHFESLHINPDVEELSGQDTEYLIKRIGKRFERQQEQAQQVLSHQQRCAYKKIIIGDFNNTAYSFVYKQFKNAKFKDAFELAGNGFGKTFNFKFFPLRIDFILPDATFKVTSFKNYGYYYSDHYPVMARLSW